MHRQHGRHFDGPGRTSSTQGVHPGVRPTNIIEDQRRDTVSGNSQLVPVSVNQLSPIALRRWRNGLEIPRHRGRRHAGSQTTDKSYRLTFTGVNVCWRINHLQQLLSTTQHSQVSSTVRITVLGSPRTLAKSQASHLFSVLMILCYDDIFRY